MQLSQVKVRGRESTSNVLDPCSLLGLPPPPGGSEDCSGGGPGALWVTTAESERGWFEPQAFRTGFYKLEICCPEPRPD